MNTTKQIKSPVKINGKYFQFTDIFGRVWGVTVKSVEKDYLLYLKEFNDPIPSTFDPSAIETWFCEQFSWVEIERDGILIKDISDAKKKKILDNFMRTACHEEHQTMTDFKLKGKDSKK